MPMPVLESVVTDVVRSVSEQLKDPNFTQLAVGHFVEAQPELASYLGARAARLGGAQGVVEVAFHAELMRACLRQAHGKEAPLVSLRVLDRAAQGDSVLAFSETEPALASYVASNVEHEALRLELCRIGLALVLALG